MKLSRRLIPAFAMLLVSAVLMSTASYAWFTMNTSVTAQGMSVTATASDSLVIKHSEEDTFTNVADVNMAAALELPPLTSADGEYLGKLTSEVKVVDPNNYAANWNGDNGAIGENDLDLAVADVDFVEEAFEIKTVGGSAEVYVSSITVDNNGATGDLKNAIRVAIKLGNNDWVVFQPNSSAEDGSAVNLKAGKYTGGAWAWADTDYKVPGEEVIGELIETEANEDDATTLLVRIWFEGQDETCTNYRAAKASEFDISIVFGATFITEEEGA